MQRIGCECTGREFKQPYEETASSPRTDNRACGQAMLALFERLEALPDQRQVWVLNSMCRLCLLSEDDYTPWHVVVEWTGAKYDIGYGPAFSLGLLR
jgi:hypothetical protein